MSDPYEEHHHRRVHRREASLFIGLHHSPDALSHGLDKIALVLVAATLFFSPLALGGAPLWSTCVAALLSWMALVCVAVAGTLDGHRIRLSLGALPFGLATLAMGFQLVELPAQFLNFVAPMTFQTLSDALVPLDLMPATAAISLDPPATSRALLTTLTCLFSFVAASQLSLRHRHFGRHLAQCISLSGLAVALFGFLHALGTMNKLLGIWAFSQAHPPFLTTFGNPNHLASFLAMAGIVLSMLALTEASHVKRLAWWLAYVLVAIALFLSLSRAGLAAFLVGQSLFIVCHVAFLSSEVRDRTPKFSLALAALALGGALVSGLYVASESFFREWAPLTQASGLQDSKISLAAKSTVLAKTFWTFGVGKDAFEPAFQRFLTSPGAGHQTLTHPENIAVDWIVGLGIPLGCLVLLAFCWAFVRGIQTAGTQSLRWCALAAVFAAIADDFFNFALCFIGAAVPFSVLFALGTSHRKRGAWALSSKPILAVVLALLPALIATAMHARRDLKKDGALLVELALAAPSRSQFESAFRKTVSRHPVDYFSRLAAAEFYLANNHAPQALALSGQAMALFPALSAPHRIAAQSLQALNAPAQAFSEWMISWDLGGYRERQRAEGEAARLVSLGKISSAQLVGVATSDRQRAIALAKKFLATNEVESADIIATALQEAQSTALNGSSVQRDPEVLFLKHAVARRRGDLETQLLTALQYDAALGKQANEGANLVAQALCRARRCDEAIDLLKSRLVHQNAPSLRLNLARYLLDQGRSDEAKTALNDLPTTIGKHQRESALVLEAAILRAQGKNVQRIHVLRTLLALHPISFEAKLQLAEALEESGMDSESLLEAQRLIRAIEEKAQVATSHTKLELRPQTGGKTGTATTISPTNLRILKRAKALEKRLKAKESSRRDEAMKRQFGLPNKGDALDP